MNITDPEFFETAIRGKSNEQLGMELAYSATARPHVPGWIWAGGDTPGAIRAMKPVLAEWMAKLFCPELSREAKTEARE